MDTFLYTTNLKFNDRLTQRRVLDVYNIMRYGNKDRGRAIFEKWHIPEGTYVSTTGLLIEYAPHAIKERLEKFPNVNTLQAGYIYAPYIPLHTTGQLNGVEDWLEKDLEKTLKSRYAKVQVNNNFYGTLFPGETPPETTSYRGDLKKEAKEKYEKTKKRNSFKRQIEQGVCKVIRDYYD